MVNALRKNIISHIKPGRYENDVSWYGNFFKGGGAGCFQEMAQHISEIVYEGNDSSTFPNVKHVASNHQVYGNGMMESHLDEIVLFMCTSEVHDELSQVVTGYRYVVYLQVWGM